MDRYNMHHNEAGQCLDECVEPDGEWVTYDDAMTEIAELKERVEVYEQELSRLIPWYNERAANAIRGMLKKVPCQKMHSLEMCVIHLDDILDYADKLENQDG